MSIDMAKAFTIFSGLHMNQAEAQTAHEALTPEEEEEYDQHVAIFVDRAEEFSAQAYAELGKITGIYSLQLLPADQADWTINDWRGALDAIEGSEFEAIHLANLCNVRATKHLLALVKP